MKPYLGFTLIVLILSALLHFPLLSWPLYALNLPFVWAGILFLSLVSFLAFSLMWYGLNNSDQQAFIKYFGAAMAIKFGASLAFVLYGVLKFGAQKESVLIYFFYYFLYNALIFVGLNRRIRGSRGANPPDQA